ncbi:MAG: TetR family transcriptional regulator C-terminal domain-containing protein [bacterium]
MGRASLAPVRKREILEQFHEVLKDEGIEGASIVKVAGRMGVYPSHIIHYFPTKEQLVIESVDFVVERYERSFAASLYSRARGSERLEHLLETLLSLEWAQLFEGPVFYGIYYLSLRNQAVYSSVAGMYRRFRDHLTDVLEDCRALRVLRPVHPAEEAQNIIAMVEGLGFYANLCRDADRVRAIGRAFKEMIWSRLVAEKPRARRSAARAELPGAKSANRQSTGRERRRARCFPADPRGCRKTPS